MTKKLQSTHDDHIDAHRDVLLFSIAEKMRTAHLPEDFISGAIRTALQYEGVADLVMLWSKEKNVEERNEIIADIQELIDDCAVTSTQEFPYIKFNDLDAIAKHIRAFKDSLRFIVDEKGGIAHLSEMTQIPQPSLSRFFSSNTMPRRNTLLKISKALNLDAVKIESLWSAL